MGNPTLRRKLFRDIRKTWALFLSLVIAVVLALSMYAAMKDSYENLQDSYQNAFTTEGFPDLFVTISDPQAFADKAAKQEGVAHVRTRIQVDLPVTAKERSSGITDKLVGRVIEYPTSGRPDVAALTSLSGAKNPSPGKVLVEKHFADTFGFKRGDTFTVTTFEGPEKVTVDGVVATAEYLWPAPSRQEILVPPNSFGVLYATPEDARAWTGTGPNQALVLLTDSARQSSDVLTSLRKTAIDDGATDVYDRAQQPSNSILQEDIDSLNRMAVYFPAMFLLAAGLAIYVLLSRRVNEERQIIGTLRSTGVRSGPIGWHYLSYALLTAVIGTAIGLPLGAALARTMTTQYTGIIGLPESLTVYGGMRTSTALTGIAMALFATAFAAWWPTRRALRIMPAEAMRGDVPTGSGQRSWMERVIPGSQNFSAKWRMVLRSVSRSGARSAFTAIGVALAILLVLATLGVLTSLRHVTAVEFNEVMLNDGQADFAREVTDADLRAISRIRGVEHVESATFAPISAKHAGSVYSTALGVYDRETMMHGFIDESGHAVELPNNGVLVDQNMTTQLPDLQVGDEISLKFTGLDDKVVKTTVRGFTFEPLGSFVYADKKWVSDNISELVPSSVLLTTAPDADSNHIRKEVSAQPAVVTYSNIKQMEATVKQWSALFNAIAVFMLILGAVMAFAIIFTTMSVSISERTREVATFRAAGVKFSTIASMVRWENMIVAVFGVIPGVILGILSTRSLVSALSTDEMGLVAYIPASIVVLTVVTILLVALLSQVPGMWRVRRMNVAEVVRERS